MLRFSDCIRAVVTLTPRAVTGSRRAGVWCGDPPSLIFNSFEVSLHPSPSRTQPVYSLWGFRVRPSVFSTEVCAFSWTHPDSRARLTCVPSLGSFSLSLLSPTKTQERYLPKAFMYSSETKEGSQIIKRQVSSSFCMVCFQK